jgi:nicotinamidase-related amidase
VPRWRGRLRPAPRQHALHALARHAQRAAAPGLPAVAARWGHSARAPLGAQAPPRALEQQLPMQQQAAAAAAPPPHSVGGAAPAAPAAPPLTPAQHQALRACKRPRTSA